MISLYEISESYQNIIENLQIDIETGEILNIEILDNIQSDFSEKAESIALFIKNLNAEAEAIKSEEKNLEQRRKTIENKAERLKKYLAENMVKTGNERLFTPRVGLSFRKSIVVEADEHFIKWASGQADEYLTYKAPEINKAFLKKALNNGIVFEFARLKENMNLQIK